MTQPREGQPAGSSRMNLRERAARRRTANQPRSIFLGCFIHLLLTVGVAVGFCYFVYNPFDWHFMPVKDEPARSPVAVSTGDGKDAVGGSASDGTSPVDVEEAAERKREFETAQGVLKQRLALAKLRQKQVLDVGAQVSEAAQAWRAELDRWDHETTDLLQDDTGKALAANKPYVKMFRVTYDAERPGREDANRLLSLAEEIVSTVRISHDNPADEAIPPDEMLTQLQDLLRQARDSRDRQREARERIAALALRSKAGGAAGTKPLADAVQEQAEEEHLAEAASIAETTRKAQSVATERVARAKADQIREVGEKQEAVVRAETEALKVQKERERIRKLAENPAIQAQFSPFLALGKWQYNYGLTGAIPEPASYKTLMREGHLQDEKTFARAMAGYGNFALNQVGNDRPHVPYPSDQAGMKRMGKLFELFKELAPTWIEMGKLLP